MHLAQCCDHSSVEKQLRPGQPIKSMRSLSSHAWPPLADLVDIQANIQSPTHTHTYYVQIVHYNILIIVYFILLPKTAILAQDSMVHYTPTQHTGHNITHTTLHSLAYRACMPVFEEFCLGRDVTRCQFLQTSALGLSPQAHVLFVLPSFSVTPYREGWQSGNMPAQERDAGGIH